MDKNQGLAEKQVLIFNLNQRGVLENCMRDLIGKGGEIEASDYLLSKGYQILYQNFRCRFGEIDIIAYDEAEKALAFVEVRTKTTTSFGRAEESITSTKKQRLYKTAMYYLTAHPANNFRFDLIAINLFEEKPLKHYKNFFQL